MTPGCLTDGEATIEVQGRNFVPNATVDVTAEFYPEDEIEQVTTSAYGSFSVTLSGYHLSFTYVFAEYVDLFEPDVYVYVNTCDPQIEISPQCAPGDTSIDVRGAYFTDGGATEIQIGIFNLSGERVGGTDPIEPAEAWEATVNFDEPPAPGEYEVRATAFEGDFQLAEASTWFVTPCPTISVTPDCASAGGPPDTIALTVTTDGFITSGMLGGYFIDFVVFAGTGSPFDSGADPQEFTADEPDDGDYEIRPYLRAPGTYTILAKQGYSDGGDGNSVGREFVSATTTFTVPCGEQPEPLVYVTPDCVPASQADDYIELAIHGRNFAPNTQVRIWDEWWDPQFSEPSPRIVTTSEYGAFNYIVDTDSNDSIWFEPEDPPHKISVSYVDEETGHDNTAVAFAYVGICSPQIEVTPTCGPTGTDQVRVVGSGWSSGYQDIQISIGGPGIDLTWFVPAAESFDELIDLDVSLADGLYSFFAAQPPFEGTLALVAPVAYFSVPCPTITVNPVCSPSGGPPETVAIEVVTGGFFSEIGSRIEIVFDAPLNAGVEFEHEPQEWWFEDGPNGEFTITPYLRPDGIYRIVAKQGYDRGDANVTGWTHRVLATAEIDFSIPCVVTSGPLLYVTPDCVTTGEPTEIRVHGRNFDRNRDVEIWDVYNEEYVTVTTSDFGTFDVLLPFTLDFYGINRIAAYYPDEEFYFDEVAFVYVAACRAQITVNPRCDSGPLSVEISGQYFEPEGFGYDEIVISVYDLDDDDLLLGQTFISAAESFTTTVFFVEYPEGLPDGQYLVTAEGGESDYAQAFLLVPCPTIEITPVCGPPGAPPDQLLLYVTTSGFLEFDLLFSDTPNRIEIVFDNPATADEEGLYEPQEWVFLGQPNGTFVITPYFRSDGVYRVVAKQGYEQGNEFFGGWTHQLWAQSEPVDFDVPCPGPAATDPLLYTTPDCLSSFGDVTIDLHGRNFDRNRAVQVFDRVTQTGTSTTTSDYGTFNIDFEFVHESGGYHNIVATYVDDPETILAYVILGDCGPRISVTPTCGSGLTSITVTGAGFDPDFHFIDVEVRDLDTFNLVSADFVYPDESFEVALFFDGPAPDGQYIVLAEQQNEEETQLVSAVTYFVLPCPTVTVEPICGPAGGPPDTLTLMVTASGFLDTEGFERLEIVFDPFGEPQEFVTEAANGTFEIRPYARPDGFYTVLAKQGYYRGDIFSGTAFFVFPGATNTQWTEAYASFAVPCPPEPLITIDGTCGAPALVGQVATYAITVTGTGFLPGGVEIYFDAEEVAGAPDFFEATAAEDGTLNTLIEPAHRPPGAYVVWVQQLYFDFYYADSAIFVVPCAPFIPALELDPQCGAPQLVDDEPRDYELTLTGEGWIPGPIELLFNAGGPANLQQSFSATIDELGILSAVINPAFMPEGEYAISARQELVDVEELLEFSVVFFVPCAPPLPELTIDPACGPVARDQPEAYEITLTGVAFLPGPVTIIFDFEGALEETFTAVADEDGFFEAVIKPTGRAAGIFDIVARQEVEVSGTIVEAAAIFVVDCEGPIMRVVPRSGPRGLVVRVEGFNFPPETTINLTWNRGINAGKPIPAVTDVDGLFVRYILIFRSDFTGARDLTPSLADVEDAFPEVSARYLVVPGSMQPPFETENPFALPETTFRTRR